MNVRRFLRQALTIARREFSTTVFQPAFLVFLLSPLALLAAILISGSMMGPQSSGTSSKQVVMIAEGEHARIALETDRKLRSILDQDQRASLLVERPKAHPAVQAQSILATRKTVVAVLYGPLDRPTIIRTPMAGKDEMYLAQIADQTLRAIRLNQADTSFQAAEVTTGHPDDLRMMVMDTIGSISIMIIFMATYFLSSPIATGFAEERSSKIIEILASSATLESIFFGKMLGELSVASLFMGFWIAIFTAAAGVGLVMTPAIDAGIFGIIRMGPAAGWMFPLLFFLYFMMSYLINSCTILGVASLVSTPRGAAIVTMPFTLLQFGMMSLSTYAAMNPDTVAFKIAALLPYSSPLVMVAQAATSDDLIRHVIAFIWQASWFAIIVHLSARAFRRGALNGGSGIRLAGSTA